MRAPLRHVDVSTQPFRPELREGGPVAAAKKLVPAGPQQSKYRAVKTAVDGIVFHSAAEARRYSQLKLLERAGHIRQIELQPVYKIEIGGKHICKVILDFRYWEGGSRVVEDVKGRDTAVSKLKRKLVEAAYPGTKILLVAA